MKLTLLLIPLLFLMTSCTIDWNDEKDKKIMELEKQISNNAFEKNQQCLSLKDGLNIKIEKYNQESSNSKYRLIKVFYSKAHNDCLWILNDTRDWGNAISDMQFLIPSGGEWIGSQIDQCNWYSNFEDNSKDANNCPEFENKIKELNEVNL